MRQQQWGPCSLQGQAKIALIHKTRIYKLGFSDNYHDGDVAQMVERSLSMRQVVGSMPIISTFYFASVCEFTFFSEAFFYDV